MDATNLQTETDQLDKIFTLFGYVALVNRCQKTLSASVKSAPAFEEIIVEDQIEKIEIASQGQIEDEVDRLSSSVDNEDHRGDVDVDTNVSQSSELVDEHVEETIDNQVLDEYNKALSEEFVSVLSMEDEELSSLPEDNIKQTFSYFMLPKFQMPDIDETPLGIYLQKLQDDKYEDLTTYELQQMLNKNSKENKMLTIQNAVFKQFLERNDPRYDKDEANSLESTPESSEISSDELELTSAELVRSKVLFPVLEEYESEKMYFQALNLLSRVVEHEIKEVHKSYEIDLNRYNCKMRDLGAVRNSVRIHRDKLRETEALLNALVVKRTKRRISFELLPFAEFLKAAIKQDQQDLRRLRVLTYENNKKTTAIQKHRKRQDSVRKVDLELYEIKCKQLTAKLKEQTEEFLQLKKIFDSYQTKLDKFQKKLDASKKLSTENQKRHSKYLRLLEVQRICYQAVVKSLFELIEVIETLHKPAEPLDV